MSAESKVAPGASKTDTKNNENTGFLSGLKPSSIVYWTRVGFAVLAGVTFNLSGLGEQGIILGTVAVVGVGILVYAAHVAVIKYLLGYGEAELTGPRKHVSIGMGSYIAWLIFTTVLVNTILHPALPLT